MAFIPSNLLIRFKLMMMSILGPCGPHRMIQKTIQNELNEIVIEAERRESNKNNNK